MSTSDAGQTELGGGGGESARRPHRAARAATDRALQDETFKTFQQEIRLGDDIPVCQGGFQSAIRREGTHKALIFGTKRLRQEEEAAHCGDSEVQVQNPDSPRFKSCLFFTLSTNQNLNKAERKLKNLTERQRAEIGDNNSQVSQQASPRNHPSETASDYLLPETVALPTKKEENVTLIICSELGTTRDLSVNHSFSNGDFGSHECNGLHKIPCGPQPRRNGSGSVAFEQDRNCINLENHKAFEEPSSLSVTMLSSTVVTVLAPHWSNKLRRTRKFEGGSTSDAQGNLPDVTNTAANCAQEGFQEIESQHCMERVLDRSQAQQRTPFLCTRSNTVGWSSKSGPASLDYESRRKMLQTISLDVNSGRMDNRKIHSCALSPVNTAALPLSPLSLNNPNEQRRTPQTGHQSGLSASSSKPTTSSMLLSLRRFNSNAASTFTNNEQEKVKPLLSPSAVSCRTAETGPLLSPSSSSHRGRKISEKHFFSPSYTNQEDTLQQLQTITGTQASVTCSKHSFLAGGPSERQHINTNLFSESPVSLTRKSLYDQCALVKTPAVPRTTLPSHSWWKQVTQEDTSPLPPGDTKNIKDKSNTLLVPPCYNHTDLASPSPTDNTSTTESVCKGNVNLAIKAQGGTHNLTQRNSPEHESDRLVKQQNGSKLNREPQEPQSLPSALSSSKISTTTAQTTLSHPKDLNKHDVSNSSFTENVTEPPTTLNPKSSNTPTEISSKLHNHGSSRFNCIPTSPHKSNSESLTKQSFSHTNTKTLSGLPSSPSSKASASFYFQPGSSQTKINTSSHTCSSPHTPKYTKTSSATPIGFERSYASIPKSFHSKTVSSLIPAVSASSKTNCSPASTASIASFTTCSHPATALPSAPLLTPPITPARTPSPTTISSLPTPPTTPVITSQSYSETSSPKKQRHFQAVRKQTERNRL
ncbi:hypothetical protein Q5P01_003213 [Channa striata]|uniref:Uncharacterized protein n=1 Tax=Channa striata TaxID=64152 RepID=A0AA88NKJ3_CHASR|nr:hypothetical protein Q5P01_003213 [Channa striata]